jgi:hypothetical protein
MYLGYILLVGVAVVSVLALCSQLWGLVQTSFHLSVVFIRLLILIVWIGAVCFTQIGLLLFNYCESNCPHDLNLPTASILLALLAVDALSIWLALIRIPK